MLVIYVVVLKWCTVTQTSNKSHTLLFSGACRPRMKFFWSVAESLILLLSGSSWSCCIIRRRLNTRPIMQKRKCDKNWVLCWLRMLDGECVIDSKADHLLFYRSLSSPPRYPLQMPRRHWMLITESRKSRPWSTGWNRKLCHDAVSFPSESVWRSAVIVQFMVDRGTAVAQWLRCCATNRKVAGSIPDGVIGIFHWHNPSDRTMALESTQPLTEVSTRRISWG